MITYTGRSVWPSWTDVPGVPTDVSPSLDDLAVGMGRQSRFAGQTRAFYTVLCHALNCGIAARDFWPDDDLLRKHLLVHDGHEAILSDTPSTWKTSSVRDNEDELDARIARELKLPALDDEQRALLKIVDAAALAAEAHALGHAEAEKWWPKDDFGVIESRLFELTVLSLAAGNPVRYLTPETAIVALSRNFYR